MAPSVWSSRYVFWFYALSTDGSGIYLVSLPWSPVAVRVANFLREIGCTKVVRAALLSLALSLVSCPVLVVDRLSGYEATCMHCFALR